MIRFVRLTIAVILSFTWITSSSQEWVTMMESGAPLPEVQQAFNDYFRDKPYERGKGWKQFKRWEYMMESRVDESGRLPRDIANQGLENAILSAAGTQAESNGNAYWVARGPFAVPNNGYGAGRLNSIAFHPSNSSIMWVGSPSGGLWKTTDGGQSWTTNTDALSVIGISDIIVNPVNPEIIYIGTGDPNGGDTYSLGVLKSTDGGLTWNSTGLSYQVISGRQVYKLLMMPGNPDVLLAATSNGIFKTNDAGQSWTLTRSGSYRDMEFKPGDPSVVYAVTTARLFVSTNYGDNFSLSNALIPVSTTSRLSLAVTAADPNYIYVLAVKSSDSGFEGIYQSTDGGSTFTLKASTPNLLGWQSNGSDAGGQGWYDLALAVSPINKDLVFVGGVNIWKSVNGGSNWSISAHWTGAQGKPLVHADIHELEFTSNGDKLYACSDGGLSVSSNNGVTWTDLHANLSIGQIYRIGVSQTTPGLLMSGWQDNGSNLRLQNNSWKKALGGDGMECMIDHQNSNYMYGSLYYGALKRSIDGGSNWSDIGTQITEDGAWVTPFEMDPNNPAILYAGYINVWRSTNRGGTWSKISNFSGTNTLRALAIAPSNSQYIYTSTQTALYRTTDGGSTWTNITAGTSNGTITDIAVSAYNPNHVYVTKGGYYGGMKVYRSRDGGATWQNYSGSLPNLPANTIAYEIGKRDALYVGLDVGVYYRDSLMSDWLPFNLNLPNVIVNDLEIQYSDHKLVAGTYGRGVWQTDTWDWINSLSENTTATEPLFSIYPNPADQTLTIRSLQGSYSDTRFAIHDITGREVFKEAAFILSDNYQVDVSSFAEGIYVLHISSDRGSFSSKFVVRH